MILDLWAVLVVNYLTRNGNKHKDKDEDVHFHLKEIVIKKKTKNIDVNVGGFVRLQKGEDKVFIFFAIGREGAGGEK